MNHADDVLRRAENVAGGVLVLAEHTELSGDVLNAAAEAMSAVQHLRHVLLLEART